ncbi:hypothetical protein A2716_01050 [candidate division WWE3 bacterium RIFCSPHIGHO2_01_FULL_40_23]|uniref:Glycosyl transferase n=1 Tax=candidate division WWE3 bacterium RIFCSPLOWO2_01_FULL_41_18 TaxID=1802625 RepID=A0A1F4VEK2_UNCKA|nr:MAG: hypothetical protein A2716_01050 [candidate division WWE3 bacterium RIFCSPHIGHO2_01_FULL_40_23]OGC55575.1 MAG: hypothetical protein A3A78_01320 [candidate division WWE3 bacterium RIFCSPLOWO2_01_FULL_41_18]
MTNIEILGVKVSKVGYKQSLFEIDQMLKDQKKHQIVTTNSEFILNAQGNKEFLNALNSADLSIPDGFGVLYAAKYLRDVNELKRGFLFPVKSFLLGINIGILGFLNPSSLDVLNERVTGTDLMLKIFDFYREKGISVYLVGTSYQTKVESARNALSLLQERFPLIKFVGSCSGRYQKEDGSFNFVPIQDVINKIDSDIKVSGLKSVDFCFVAFGQVKQELWIKENIRRLPFKVMMGVGGAFDFITGRRKRAPKFLQERGLELFFRPFSELSNGKLAFERLGRVLSAFPYFPLLVYFRSLMKK